MCSQNIANLCNLNASDDIIHFCQALPVLASYSEKWSASTEGCGLGLPSSLNEAQLVKQNITHLKEDILLAKKALNLPLLEPLTKERLRNLTSISMGSLLASLHVSTSHSIFAAVNPVPTKSATVLSGTPVATTTSKTAFNPSGNSTTTTPMTGSNREEEWESGAITVIETAVEIYQTIATFIQRSPRSERLFYDNFLYLASWLLFSGLQSQMTCTSQVIKCNFSF